MKSVSTSPKKEKKGQKNADDSKITIKPYKKKYLQIFKGENSYYLLDRYKYDQNAIMMLLDLNKINKLGDIFLDYPDGIEKTKFIEIMKGMLKYNPDDPMDLSNLIYGLYKFFCEIDFNGDGHMQWEEFTQFIIDTVEGDNEAKVDDNETDNKSSHFNEKQMIKYKRYHVSQKIKDSNIHKKDIIDAVFLPRSDLLVINEYGTKCLRIYNPKTGKNERVLNLEDFLKTKSSLVSLLDKKKKKNNGANDLARKNTTDNINTNKISNKDDTSNSVTYSVLSMRQAQTNIVAICLSDNRILFFNFASDGRAELIYELHTPTLEKRVWYLPDHNTWFASGSKLKDYDFFTLNELDVEFELKSQKYECYYNEGHPYREHYCCITKNDRKHYGSGIGTNSMNNTGNNFFGEDDSNLEVLRKEIEHQGEILDCIEISKPMMVLTACMDGKIRLINLNDRSAVKFWKQHTLGVRSLDYNPLIESVGYVLSVGFEYYINLYCTDLSIEEAFKGRLEGHYAPVITCKFLSKSYMAVSVDEEGNVRIWDTRLRLCLQLIPTPKKNFKVNNLLNMSKYNKFIVFGNKLIFYDAKYKEEAENKLKSQIKDDNYPIKVDYNKYYQQFFVTTSKDIRIYNKEGVLFKNFKKLKDNEHFDGEVQLKYLLFENNYRKFYLGFSNGAIFQYNAGNGSLIKPINEEEIEKDGIQSYKYDHTKEISSMYYFFTIDEKNEDGPFQEDHLILITTSYDSLINIYNEYDPEETVKLRTIRGGHTLNEKVNEINCMDFSVQMNLFATGSTDGLVTIWDFEMSKIDDTCFLAKNQVNVNCLKFLDPYPILVVGYSDGTFYFWGTKGNVKFRGLPFLKGRNFYKPPHKNSKIEIRSLKVLGFLTREMDKIVEIESDKNKFIEKKKKDVPLYEYLNENSLFMDEAKIQQAKISKENKEREEYERQERKKSMNDFENYNESDDEKDNEFTEYDIIEDIIEDMEIIDKGLDPLNYESSDKNRFYLFGGDSKGYLKVYDLLGVIRNYDFSPISKVYIKSTFNILKKDDINVETSLNHNIKSKTDKPDKYLNQIPFTNFYHSILIKEFKAHDDEITSLEIIDEPLSFCTASKDKLVKVWDMKCNCIGVINTLPKLTRITEPLPPWRFKVNEEKILEREIEELVRIFEAVHVPRIEIPSKEHTKAEETIIVEQDVQVQKAKKPPPPVGLSRFKKIEKEDDKKKNKKVDTERNNLSFEGEYLMEFEKKVENLINMKLPNQGMNEISCNVIDKIITVKKDNKLVNEALKNLNSSNAFSQNKTQSSQFGKTKNKFHTKESYKSPQHTQPQHQQPLELNKAAKSVMTILTFKKNALKNLPNKPSNLNLSNPPSNIINGNNLHLNVKSNINLPPVTEGNLPSNSPSFNRESTQKETAPTQPVQTAPNISNAKKRGISDNHFGGRHGTKKGVYSNKIRETFFAEKLFKNNFPNNTRSSFYNNKTTSNFSTNKVDENNKSNAFYNTHFSTQRSKNIPGLPPLNNEKIIFRCGEIDKLLNYETYMNSYKKCCDSCLFNPNMDNTYLKENYKNNWERINDYVNTSKNYKFKENPNDMAFKFKKDIQTESNNKINDNNEEKEI